MGTYVSVVIGFNQYRQKVINHTVAIHWLIQDTTIIQPDYKIGRAIIWPKIDNGLIWKFDFPIN